MGPQYASTALGAYMGVHLTIQLFMLMMQGSYVFSGKDEDVDLLLLKAESAARSRWCYLTETDEEGAGTVLQVSANPFAVVGSKNVDYRVNRAKIN